MMTQVSINKNIFNARYLFITGEGISYYRASFKNIQSPHARESDIIVYNQASLKIPKVHKSKREL